MEESNEWVSCICDNEYEVLKQFPYPIRLKSNQKIIHEWINGGYINCKLNQIKYLKHRIIAKQFIPNPNDFSEVDHINRNKTDNRIENLRWVDRSTNMKNVSSRIGVNYEFIDELPKGCIPISLYNTWEFKNYYIDDDNNIWFNNGVKYRKLHICLDRTSEMVSMNDIDNVRHHISINKLIREYK